MILIHCIYPHYRCMYSQMIVCDRGSTVCDPVEHEDVGLRGGKPMEHNV